MPKFTLPITPPREKTPSDWQEFLKGVSYRPKWSINAFSSIYSNSGVILYIDAEVVNAYRQEEYVQLNSSYHPQHCYSEDDMLNELYNCILATEKHELGEFLVVNGKRPFDPHK